MAPVIVSPLLASALVAIQINPFLRLGIRQQVELAIPFAAVDHAAIKEVRAAASSTWSRLSSLSRRNSWFSRFATATASVSPGTSRNKRAAKPCSGAGGSLLSAINKRAVCRPDGGCVTLA